MDNISLHFAARNICKVCVLGLRPSRYSSCKEYCFIVGLRPTSKAITLLLSIAAVKLLCAWALRALKQSNYNSLQQTNIAGFAVISAAKYLLLILPAAIFFSKYISLHISKAFGLRPADLILLTYWASGPSALGPISKAIYCSFIAAIFAAQILQLQLLCN